MSIIKTNYKSLKSYIKVDSAFITNPKYSKLKTQHAFLFGILKNQEDLSIKTTEQGDFRYVDKNGDIFIVTNQAILSRVTKLSVKTLYNYLEALVEHDLLEIVRQQDTSKPNIIYVGNLEQSISYGEYYNKIKEEYEQEKKEKEKKRKEKVINLKPKTRGNIKNKTKAPSAPTPRANKNNPNEKKDY